MYRVYCDGQTVYNDRLESLQIFSPTLALEVNKTGSFEFVVQHDHPLYNRIQRLKSVIEVYQKDYLLFRGRVLDEESGFLNQKRILCEGELAYLLDSIQSPYDYSGSIAGYLQILIDRHNGQLEEGKRFALGQVTVEDANDYIVRSNSDYVNTWRELEDKLLKVLGGYIITRHEKGVTYIDYLKDFSLLSPQKIKFGENLLDLKRIRKGADISTAVIPLGAKREGTDERLTIASVNGGSDMLIDAEAAAQYGTIVKQITFDDVTEAGNLLTKGKAYLAEIVNEAERVELTAADMATVEADFSSFRLGTYVEVNSPPHGIGQRLLVNKISINLLDPAANKLVLGGTAEPFSAQITHTISQNGKDGRNGQDAVTLRIDSSRGTVFKNSEVSTVLQAVIFKGGKTITDADALHVEFGSNAYLEWAWQRMGENTFGTILATDSRIGNGGFSFTLTPDDVDTKVVFKCQLITD